MLIVDPRTGALLARPPRGTASRLVNDSALFEGTATEHVTTSRPPGATPRRLQELSASPVERHSVDYYAALAEVVRWLVHDHSFTDAKHDHARQSLTGLGPMSINESLSTEPPPV